MPLPPYPSQYNYRQTVNDCGPFAVAAVVRALTQENVSSAEFAQEIQWRLPNKYTLPRGLEEQLKEHNIKIKTPEVHSLAEDQKIAYLRQELSQNHPLIILGERTEFVGTPYEHYIVLLGFDEGKNEFYVYDPFYTKGNANLTQDANGALPGNRTYSSEALLDFWSKGGLYGLYEWYVIAASN